MNQCNYKEITYRADDKLYKAKIVYPHSRTKSTVLSSRDIVISGELRVYDKHGRLRLKRLGLTREELKAFENNLHKVADVIMTSEE